MMYSEGSFSRLAFELKEIYFKFEKVWGAAPICAVITLMGFVGSGVFEGRWLSEQWVEILRILKSNVLIGLPLYV